MVVPWRRCRETAAAVWSAPAEKLPPPPPCTWVSTKPGTTVDEPNSQSGCRGGDPLPTAVIVVPEISIHPGRNNSEPVSTVLAVSNTSDALPVGLGPVGLPVVIGKLQSVRCGIVDEHRGMRVVLQDAGGPQR